MSASDEEEIERRVREMMAEPENAARMKALTAELLADPEYAGLDGMELLVAAEKRGRLLGWKIMHERGFDVAPLEDPD